MTGRAHREADMTRMRRILAGLIVILLGGLVGLSRLYREPTPDERWQFHANNTTTVHYKDGVTCFYHEAWHQMSCVYNNATYGPKEY